MLIKIPEKQHDDALKLFSLSDNQWQLFLDALGTVDANYDLDVFLDQFASKIDEDILPDARQIISLLLRLCTVRFTLKLNTDNFVGEIILAAQDANLISGDVNIDNISSTLSQVFSDDSALNQSAKIGDLMWDRPNIVENIRVLSDMRPVFGTNADAAPQSFLIDHTLRMNFQTAAGPEEIYLSLDGDSLRELGKAVDRAIRKEGNLIDYANSINVTVHAGYTEDVN